MPSHCYNKFIPTDPKLTEPWPKMIRRMPQIRWLLNSESSSVADTFVLMLPVHSVVYNHFLYPSYPVLQRAGCNCNNRMHDWPQWQLLRSTFNNPTAADHPNSLPHPKRATSLWTWWTVKLLFPVTTAAECASLFNLCSLFKLRHWCVGGGCLPKLRLWADANPINVSWWKWNLWQKYFFVSYGWNSHMQIMCFNFNFQ